MGEVAALVRVLRWASQVRETEAKGCGIWAQPLQTEAEWEGVMSQVLVTCGGPLRRMACHWLGTEDSQVSLCWSATGSDTSGVQATSRDWERMEPLLYTLFLWKGTEGKAGGGRVTAGSRSFGVRPAATSYPFWGRSWRNVQVKAWVTREVIVEDTVPRVA